MAECKPLKTDQSYASSVNDAMSFKFDTISNLPNDTKKSSSKQKIMRSISNKENS